MGPPSGEALTAIPTEVTKAFGTAEANQVSVDIRVVEGESDDPDDCVEIGTCVISDLPKGRPAESMIDVTYCYGQDGRLHVEAKDRETSNDAKVEIIREHGMSEQEVGAAKDFLEDLKIE